MAKSRCGAYIVGNGMDFRPKRLNTIGYDNSLDPMKWYVVNSHTLTTVGKYESEELAIKLAKFLDKADRQKLSNEIEKVLRGTLDD